MVSHTASRRRVLQGLTATGLGLGLIGVGSADASASYVVTGGSTARLEDAGFTVTRELADGAVRIVTGPANAEDDLDSLDGVQGVTEDFRLQLADPIETEEHTEDAGSTDQQWDKQITDAFEAHHTTTGESSRIVIADTGIDHTHPELQANVNTDASVSFVDGDGTPSDHVGDPNAHGTHCAGIAAATGDEEIVGTAPDAELVSVRVLNADGGGFFTDILAGADYAAEIGADVVNLSLGAGPYPPDTNSNGLRVSVQKVMQSVARRGTVSSVAAGNAATNLQQGGQYYVPGTVQGVMTVSATGPEDNLAFYSNYGTNEIEVGAPGGGLETEAESDAEDYVYSTVPGDAYAWFAGTSMAAPQVAGLVGLVRDINPGANVKQVENAIAQGADLVTGRSSPEFGAGRINALDTVEQGGSPGRR